MSENNNLNDTRRREDIGRETLFTESTVEIKPNKRKKKSILKLQKQLIAGFLVLLILLGAAYAVVYRIVTRNVFLDELGEGNGDKYYVVEKGGKFVITDTDGYTLDMTEDKKHYVTGAGNVVDVDEETGEVSYYAYVDTEDYEQVGANDRLLIFPHTKQAQMDKIEVHNEHGSFTFKRQKNSDGSTSFVIKGYEDIPYSPELFSQLVVGTGYTLTIQKIDRELSAKYGLAEYGLVEEERVDEEGKAYTYKPAWYRITDLEGNEYKVIIGDPIPSNAGYYVKLDSRDSVYMISNGNLDGAVLRPLEELCTPTISLTALAGDYFDVSTFMFWNDPTPLEDPMSVKPMITFDYIDLEDRNKTEFQTTPYFSFTELTLTDNDGKETKYDVTPKIGGYFVNEYAVDNILQFLYMLPSRENGVRVVELGVTDEDLEKYGLNNPAYRMMFEFKDFLHDIPFSAKTEEGTYYCFSAVYDMIVEIDKKYLDFFEYNDEKWMSKDFIQFNIAFIEEVEIIAPNMNYTFLCDNSKSMTTDKVASDKLEVLLKETGAAIDREQFRDLFITLVMTEFEGESGLSDDDAKALIADPKNLILTVHYKTEGRDREFKFYRYSERRAYVTVNGVGGLYVLVPQCEKIISDAYKVVNGGDIDGSTKYD